MRFTQIILSAFAIGMSAVSATIVCDTTTGSPTTGDVTAAINQLKGLGHTQTCNQNNQAGSMCTTMVSHGTAALAICGPWGESTLCFQDALWAEDVQGACLKDGRVGGQYVVNDACTIEVIHS